MFGDKSRSNHRDTKDRSSSPAQPEGITGVAAVIVTHNSAQHLEALGRAFESGSLRPTHMLVVDNASSDDTVVRARSAGFEVHEMGSNKGFGAACNAGLRAVSTEFVLFCNPDARPSPNAIERLMTTLKNSPTTAIVGAAFGEPIEARRFSRITGNIVGFLPRNVQRRVRRFRPTLPVDQNEDHVVVDYVEGAFMLGRVSALCSVHGFDECFFLYCEEEDLCRRLGKSGWQTLFVPSAIVAHGSSASSKGVDKMVMAPFRIHSLYLYYRKYHSRAYAEFARCAIAVCVIIDRWYRALTRRQQVYGPKTALAPFRSIDSIRRDYERRQCITAS